MTRPPYTLLVCPDAELARRERQRLLAAHGAVGLRHRTAYGDEPLPGSFWQDLASPGLFGAAAGVGALVVRRAEQLPAQTWKELAPYLTGATHAAWLFLCLEGSWERGQPRLPAHLAKQPFLKLARERGWEWRSPGLTARTMPEHVAQALAEAGLPAPAPVLEALCQRLPEDAAAVAAEVAKLALSAPVPGTLTLDDIALVSGGRTLDLWQILDAVEQGRDRGLVWRQVLDAGGSGGTGLLFPLLAGLGREARGAGQILCGEAGAMPPWLARKKEQLARRLGPDGLAELLSLALEAELAVKSGEKSEDQALEELVAGLYLLFGQAPRPPGKP